PSNPKAPMPATDDEIREKYLERAIRELNSLTRELQSCPHCPRGNMMPVLGSGHPQADVFLLKHSPQAAEVEEGVAFYGRAGNALMKSLRRLSIDPLAVYGTLCVKCPVADASLADPACGPALASFLVAPALPDVGGAGDLNTAVSDAPATFLLASCVLVLVPARDDWAALALIVAGAGLLAGAVTVAGSAPLAGITKPL